MQNNSHIVIGRMRFKWPEISALIYKTTKNSLSHNVTPKKEMAGDSPASRWTRVFRPAQSVLLLNSIIMIHPVNDYRKSVYYCF